MGFWSYFGNLSPLQMNVFKWRSKGKELGSDTYGNTYFESKPIKGYSRPRRWVIYSGTPEASSIPPEYHGWLHHQTDAFPDNNNLSFRRKWQKPHTPNMTGTNLAYRPKGHMLEKGTRDKAVGDYEPWKPE